MKIILDECVPGFLRKALSHHDIVGVQYKGWSGIKNGELLRLVSAEFDVFITSDKNLRHQQNLSRYGLSVILLPSNQVPAIRAILSEIDAAVYRIQPGEFIQI
jgi:hypothetical protein